MGWGGGLFCMFRTYHLFLYGLYSLQIHETIEYINQLKTERDFMLSFSNNPQDFIQDWLKSQSRDLKVNIWSQHSLYFFHLTMLKYMHRHHHIKYLLLFTVFFMQSLVRFLRFEDYSIEILLKDFFLGKTSIIAFPIFSENMALKYNHFVLRLWDVAMCLTITPCRSIEIEL